MTDINSVRQSESLPKPSAIGERALWRGVVYEVTSLDPPVWSLVSSPNFIVTNNFLLDSNVTTIKNCHFEPHVGGGIRITDNKLVDYIPIQNSEYYEVVKDLVTQREALAIYRRASSKPELVDKFLELNYHQLWIAALALGDNSVVAEPEIGGFFAEILSKGLNLHCDRLENDIDLSDLNENFKEYRSAWSDTTENVVEINGKLKAHVLKKYNESLGTLCSELDASVPNRSGKTFYELLEHEDYFIIKGIVCFFEAVKIVVAAKVGCEVSEVDLFYYFCGGGEVKVNLTDLKVRRSFSDIFYAERILKGLSPILNEIGFNFITLD